MTEKNHFVYDSKRDIPYVHLDQLGSGSCGTVVDSVMKIGDNKEVYARKTIPMPFVNGRNASQRASVENKIREAREEARIVGRLRHIHIVRVVSTYQTTFAKPEFCILFSPVAEGNLDEYLRDTDSLEEAQKSQKITTMQHWAGCLVRALDYIHFMEVQHKDIKPSNILVNNDRIYIADFGIAKNIAGLDTTGTIDGAGTRAYLSREALNMDRRGRGSDVFGLGCCFLEMATVMIADGKLETLKDYRKGAYGDSENEERVLRWIFYLLSLMAQKVRTGNIHDPAFQCAQSLPGLTFLMMDMDQEYRITARQLIILISAWQKNLFCEECAAGLAVADPNLPFHSKFRTLRQSDYPVNPERALDKWDVPKNWEAAKKLLLKEHMGW